MKNLKDKIFESSFSFSETEFDKSIKTPEKRKVQNAIYKQLEKTGTTGRFYRDDNWEGVRLVRKDITEADFSTWRTENLLTNSNFYWELVLFNANRISNSKSGSFSINKWDVSKNKSNDSTLTDISIAIDGNTKENLSGQLSYNFNSDTRKIVCDSSNLVTNFDSWQWESITITK